MRISDARLYELIADRDLKGPPAILALGQMLTNNTGDFRNRLFYRVLRTGSDASFIVPKIATLLNDPNEETRYFAITALGSIGASANSAIPNLQRIRDAEPGYMSTASAIAIEKIEKSKRKL